MPIFEHFMGHEQVAITVDEDSGLKSIIAVHSTALGPSLGGTRFNQYDSDEAALQDVLRLSRAMSYKAACAGLPLGGGKGLIVGDPATEKTDALLEAYGRLVSALDGRYITACDVGTYPADMEVIGRTTKWVTGMSEEAGGTGDSGVPTALGVFSAIQACAQHLWGQRSVAGRHVAVQGLGKVGRRLVNHLLDDGAKVTVADVNVQAVAEVAELAGVEVAAPDQVLAADAEIISPCALGAVLSEETIPTIQARAVCGGANNQLARDSDAELLRERGILYAPDYVANAGGIIALDDELDPQGWDRDRIIRRVQGIGDTMVRILTEADEAGVTPEVAAERLAERRMAAGDPTV